MKKILLVLLAFTLFSCADKVAYQIDPNEHIYGFWGGVWHGTIMVPDFIMSLFYDDVAVYATNNNGAWYNFGFIGGLGLCLRVIRLLFALIRASLSR